MACKALLLYIEFSQLKLQQAHIHDISCDTGDLYSVTNSDSALSNQEEGAETGGNDVLECEQDPGAEEPKVGCD